MKRALVFLAIAFGLTWALQIAAGFALGTFTAGENSSLTMIAIIAACMFIPAVGAFVANRAVAPAGRIDLGLHPRIKGNVRIYLIAWLRDRSGSVWPCALAHGAFNAVANIGTAVCAAPASVLGPSPLGLVSGIPLIVLGAMFILIAVDSEVGDRSLSH